MHGLRDSAITRTILPSGLVIVGALALSLTLAGCSSSEAGPNTDGSPDGPGPVAGPIPDPCALLTPTQIESATGLAFENGELNAQLSNEWQSVCEWFASDGTLTFVQVFISPDASSVTTQRAMADEVMGPAQDITVMGAQSAYVVGDGAIIGMGVTDYFVQVSYVTTGLDDVTTTTVTLAEAVVANL